MHSLWIAIEWLYWLWINWWSPTSPTYRPHKKTILPKPIKMTPKPPWVKKEIIRLKAFMPNNGCRKIANTFNNHYENHPRYPMTVSKTFVANTIKQNQYQIFTLRKKVKNHIPKAMPNNIIWAIDLTTVSDQHKQQVQVMGVIDHGSRACLLLQQLHSKASVFLLRHLLNCIECYGKPKILRTDNEPIFTSSLFRFGLWLLGVKHQRTDKHSPWQNGRIERLFWTFKNKINHLTINNAQMLAQPLTEFRFWYNHIRPHQHIQGKTPANVWNKAQYRHQHAPLYFNKWDGLLTGFYLPT